MADVTINDLPAASSVAAATRFEVVTDPTGTPVSQRASASQIATFVSSNLTDNTVALSKIVNGTGLSIIGRSANSAGANADIIAANDGEVLRRSGTSIGFGTIVAAGIASDAVTTAKILDANVTTAKIADSNVTTAKIADAAVTLAKQANLAQNRIIGRVTGSTGVPEALTPANVATICIDPTTASSLGYLGAPQRSISADDTFVAADNGKHLYHPAADTSARTWTIPANASVAFPIGTVIAIVNENAAGAITLAITSDTLRWLSSTGSRTIAANGTATLLKVTSTLWRLTGDGIT
jgi:hypothetical protein